MFSNKMRILIIVAVIGFGVYQLLNGHRSGYIAIAGASVLAAGYFRYGPIYAAFSALQQQQTEKARKLVESVKFPNLLSQQSRAYYLWIKGAIAQGDGDFESAETWIRKAIQGRLRTSNDLCIATAQLAQVIALKGQPEDAKRILDSARKIAHKEGVEEYLGQIADEISVKSLQ